MRTLAISLISLSFAVAGAGVATAQDEPIPTAAPEIVGQATAPLDLTAPAETARLSSETATSAPAEATTSASILEEAARADTRRRTGERTYVELSDETALVSRPVRGSDNTGGLLRNPDINRPNRRSFGFAMKF